MESLLKMAERHNGCCNALDWCRDFVGTSFREAWESCPRGDWLLWIAVMVGVDRRLVVLAACACVRTALVHVPPGELRPLRAIETAEAWCRGEATLKEVRAAAGAAAGAAADAAADAAAGAAACAAAAAFWAADAVCAADAVFAAACAAAAAADAASSAADAVCAAAYATTLARCSDIVRATIPWGSVPWVAVYRGQFSGTDQVPA